MKNYNPFPIFFRYNWWFSASLARAVGNLHWISLWKSWFNDAPRFHTVLIHKIRNLERLINSRIFHQSKYVFILTLQREIFWKNRQLVADSCVDGSTLINPFITLVRDLIIKANCFFISDCFMLLNNVHQAISPLISDLAKFQNV